MEEVAEKIKATQANLMATRRKRPVPDDWATSEDVQAFDAKGTTDTQCTGAKRLAADPTGNLFLTGDSDGTMAVFDLREGAISTRSNLGAGAILDGTWCNDRQAVCTASGAVIVAQEGNTIAKFSQHAGAATALDTHPSGDILVSAGYDKSYVLYDLTNSAVLTQVYGDAGKQSLKLVQARLSLTIPCRAYRSRLPPRWESVGHRGCRRRC